MVNQKHRAEHGPDAKERGLNRVRVLGRNAKRRFVLVVDLVDVLVDARMVEVSMHPVEIKVLDHDAVEAGRGDLGPCRERRRNRHAHEVQEQFGERNHRPLDDNVGEEQPLDAVRIHLFRNGFVLLDLVAVQ
eukprot:Amastigsp_a676613_317.p3 type:complete len:132 gc:universal Amastigsp_a676613_317:381-776(+)